MTEDRKSGLKSSFDLAMERMAKKGETLTPLTVEQKAAMAEVNQRLTASVAETEILFEKRIADAQASGDAEKLKKAEDDKRTALLRLRSRADDERERLRQGRT